MAIWRNSAWLFSFFEAYLFHVFEAIHSVFLSQTVSRFCGNSLISLFLSRRKQESLFVVQNKIVSLACDSKSIFGRLQDTQNILFFVGFIQAVIALSHPHETPEALYPIAPKVYSVGPATRRDGANIAGSGRQKACCLYPEGHTPSRVHPSLPPVQYQWVGCHPADILHS